MIIDPKLLLDQMGDPLARPQRSFVTQTFRTFSEQLDQAGFVRRIQTRQPSCTASLPKSIVAALLVFLTPPADGLIAYLQPPADLAVVEVLFEQLNGLEAALFECHEITLYASRIAHNQLDATGRE
jgi:hypothetical protein